MSSLLAIDYGTKRCGLARSDSNRILATGLPTFERRPGQSFHRHLRSLTEGGEYSCVVLGFPENADDDESTFLTTDSSRVAAGASPSASADASRSADGAPAPDGRAEAPPPPGSLAAEITSLGGWIERELGLPVVFWDESLTSVAAEARLRSARREKRRDKGAIDRLAAEILLQEFLDAGCPGATGQREDRS
ncbi:MAG: RuvX/YqgF family protein [Candidatus Eisenbacteria bacterium]